MIERLILAGGVIAVAMLLGFLIRASARRRTATRSATTVLPASESSHSRLLVFSSAWCSDCATQRTLIESSRDTWPRPVEVSYHDAVEESALAGQFGILMVPAVVVAAADGRVVGVRQGLVDEDRLRSMIETAA